MAGETEITGEYGSHRFAKPDGSWLIATLKSGVSIVGAAAATAFIPGVEYTFSGRWEDHKTYGRQFKFNTFIAKAPVTDSAVMAYFSRYLFGSGTNIGPVKARKILAEVSAERCLAVMKSDPKRVAEITGIKIEDATAAAEILIEIEKFEATRIQLVHLLQGRGFTQACIDSAVDDFGVCAAERIRRDPFTMLVRRYPSAGFARCEQLYRDLGLPEHRLKRQTICLWHQIQQANGSVWINAEQAVGELKRLISARVNPKKAIELGLRAKWLAKKRVDGVLWIAVREDAMNEWRLSEMIPALRDAEKVVLV
jgi:hypothetical protein